MTKPTAAPVSWRKGARPWTLGTLLCLLLAAGRPADAAPTPSATTKHVLILNSYEPTYEWTANVVRGVQSVLGTRDDVELAIEYMDSKKAFTTEYAQLLAQIYARKYGKLHFNLIVSSDDDALNFLKTYREQLFPGVPVVFCGVNGFQDQRIAGFPSVTGVNEESDLDQNIEWIARLRPATKRLIFVFDESATSAGWLPRVEAVAPRWRDRFELRVISHVTIAELQAELRRLPQDAVVFWGMFMRDRSGIPLSMRESHRIIIDASPVPVFGFTDTSVSYGAVGGFVVSGFTQGETAARMGEKVLAGVRPADVPIVRQSPNVYMLDYPAFRRWRLPTENPPPGTVVINKPFSFYERYRGYVWAALGGMGGESLIILALIAAIRTMTRKSRARLRESEERYRSIVEDGSELICRIDGAGKLLFTNGAMARLLGEQPETLAGLPIWSLVGGGEDEVAIRRRLKAITRENPMASVEQPMVNSNGEQRWVLWTYRGLFAPEGELREVQAVGTDITARRDAELALEGALRKVEVGNGELGYANQNLQGVLDSMREGLLVCDRRGQLTKVHSRAASVWFGTPASGTALWDYLFLQETPDKLWFQTAFEQITDEVLPFEVAVEQLPHTIKRGEQTWGLDCHQVFRAGQFVELVFTLADVTQQLQQDRIQQLHRELPFIVGHLLRDRDGFQAFVEETEHMLARLAGVTDDVEMRRLLHTLKGTAAIYGFELFAARCHELEDALDADAGAPTADKTAQAIGLLAQDWSTALTSFSMFLGDKTEASIRLEQSEHADFLRRLESGEDHEHLLSLARRWSDPPLSQVLAIYMRTIRQLATRLGKEIEPEIIDHRLRLPGAEMRSFLGVLVHVIRNSVDHGIEDPDDRVRAGKPRAGRVSIESRIEGGDFTVIVDDDGRGIDWEAIRVLARLRGLPATTERDLEEALFTDGISTRGAVTDLSGRGVGLSAVRQICRQLGGTIRVITRRGLGTRFEFHFANLVQAEGAATVTPIPLSNKMAPAVETAKIAGIT